MGGKIKILYVEDDALQSEMIEGQLKSRFDQQYELCCVNSLQNALDCLDRGDYGLILLDLNLVDSTGLATFRNLHQKNPAIPIVILSSNEDESLALEAIKLGAEDFLIKEMNICDILSRSIKYAIERKRIKSELGYNKDLLEQAHKSLKESHEKLLETDKMAAIGQLAAGVAHEINNPVGFVMSNLSTLTNYCASLKKIISSYDSIVEQLKSEKEAAGFAAKINTLEALKAEEEFEFITKDISVLLEESLEGTTRIKEIVQNLKSFARADDNKVQDVDINQCLKTTVKMVWNELKYKCTLHEQYGDIPVIKGFPGQLNQVFMNLLVNASHAIPERGHIYIETSVRDNHVIVLIKDTGTGIHPDHLPRLFDPFFTTKPVGKGTGLGLSISYGIIEKHNGKIKVESELFKGASFIIRLPISSPIDEQLP